MERTDHEQWKSREVARLLTLVETQRRYYQDIVASIPVGLLVLSSDITILLANAAARTALGLGSGDSLQRRLDTLLPAWLLDRAEEVLKTGVSQEGLWVEQGDKRLRISIQAIRGWDNDAAPEALLSIEDLSGVVAAAPAETGTPPTESTASESTEALAAEAATRALAPVELLEHINAAVWAVELPLMRFAYVSPQAEALLGYAPEYWIASRSFWSDRVDAADREAVNEGYRRAIQTRQPHSSEFRARRADGRTVWLRESTRVLVDAEGRPQYLIGISVDATERRMLEDQLVQSERVDAVSKLASRMAHDLNNMLMILTGYGEELMNNLPAGSPLRTDIQEMMAATERISGLTSQLLAFSRKQAAGAEPIDLEPALENAIRRLRLRLGPQVPLEIRLTAEPSRVIGNAAQLEQVVSAIIARARQAMPSEGPVRIETSLFHIHEDSRREGAPLHPGAYAVIAIALAGGAPEGDGRASLFECPAPGKEPWDQIATELSRAYGMVRQWGGDIAVISGPGETCAYRVFLPRLGAGVEIPQSVVPEPPAEAEEQRATILVVEDEAGIRALVRKILVRQNYEVLEAANGEEALAICRENPAKIDLLVTDMIMPHMGGRELADRLRADGRVMRVLFVSGYTDDASVYSGQLPPGSAFLQKPFTLGSLLDKVKEVLAEPAG